MPSRELVFAFLRVQRNNNWVNDTIR